MRRITASTVNTVRGLAVWALRAAGLILLSVGAVLLLTRAVWHLAQALTPALAFYNDGAEVGSPYAGLAMVVVGAALGALSAPIARWMIPVAPESCPRCGYAGTAGDGRCPECGLMLGDETRP